MASRRVVVRTGSMPPETPLLAGGQQLLWFYPLLVYPPQGLRNSVLSFSSDVQWVSSWCIRHSYHAVPHTASLLSGMVYVCTQHGGFPCVPPGELGILRWMEEYAERLATGLRPPPPVCTSMSVAACRGFCGSPPFFFTTSKCALTGQRSKSGRIWEGSKGFAQRMWADLRKDMLMSVCMAA